MRQFTNVPIINLTIDIFKSQPDSLKICAGSFISWTTTRTLTLVHFWPSMHGILFHLNEYSRRHYKPIRGGMSLFLVADDGDIVVLR